MTIRTRLTTVTSAALLVGAVTTACGGGGGGAPPDPSEKGFCAPPSSLVENLLPDDMADPEMPSNEDMAKAVQDWGAEIEEVGTPEGISDDARAGFEAVVEEAGDIEASDFTMEKLEELEMGGADASAEVKEQAQAFSDYLTETCGNPMDDLELPEVPDMSETP